MGVGTPDVRISQRKRERSARLILALMILGCLGVYGCAAPSPPWLATSPRPAACSQFLKALDAEVLNSGTLDAYSRPVPGFPYLRSDRFLPVLRKYLQTPAQKQQWLLELRQLDREARWKESQTLPNAALEKFEDSPDGTRARTALFDHSETCAEKLFDHDRDQEGFFEQVSTAASAHDDYSTTLRALGLYPLTSLPVLFLTRKARNEFLDWYAMPLDKLPVDGRLTFYVPENKSLAAKEEVRRLFSETPLDPFGLQRFSGPEKLRLAELFAPVIVQDVAASYDRLGRIVWKDGLVRVATDQPVVYYYFSRGLLGGHPFWQINYTFWYEGRQGPNAPWIERGPLDGMTLRVSLDGDGHPFMLDGMNNCGCYHFFIPDRQRVVSPREQHFSLNGFVPQWLPEGLTSGTLKVRINSGWHQVQRVIADQGESGGQAYRLLPYETLEALPREDGRRISIFDGRGIVRDSPRREFWLLFPMGISEVGSMRQRGRHPIKLVGRSYFEDPELFEENFNFDH